MYSVTQDFLDKANAAMRVYSLRVTISSIVNGSYQLRKQYVNGNGVLSLKIVRGQTTGGFELGGTVCAQLLLTLEKNAPIKTRDMIKVDVAFGEYSAASEWLSLGYFYADTVVKNLYSINVTAYDKMLQLEKLYISKLKYPTGTLNILNEISTQFNTPLSSSINIFNNAEVRTAPIANVKEKEYYTARDILGYTASINGGKMYIDTDNTINVYSLNETGAAISAAGVISQTTEDARLSVTQIKRDAKKTLSGLQSDFDAGIIRYANPIIYTTDSELNEKLNNCLVGLTYDNVTLKKQGTGIYSLGDLVSYTDLDYKVHRMFINGIVYDFSDGYFSETLYSLAQSDSQRDYAGSDKGDQKYGNGGESESGSTAVQMALNINYTDDSTAVSEAED